MPELKFERHVSFSPAQMLALVADLSTYPQFVPNCTDMQVDKEHGADDNTHLARMEVTFGPINQAYTSRVTIDPDRCAISATALDGPFSHLDSQWRFTAEGEGSKIEFEIDFGFSNPLIAAVAEPAFAAKQDEVLDAFVAEAKRRYS